MAELGYEARCDREVASEYETAHARDDARHIIYWQEPDAAERRLINRLIPDLRLRARSVPLALRYHPQATRRKARELPLAR